MNEKEKPVELYFGKCPVCALKEWLIKVLKLDEPLPTGRPFFETMANELKKRGIARKDWNYYLDAKHGAVIDPAKVANIPIGSEVPGFDFGTDICMECGCVYAVKLKRVKAHRQIDIPAPKRPGHGLPFLGNKPIYKG